MAMYATPVSPILNGTLGTPSMSTYGGSYASTLPSGIPSTYSYATSIGSLPLNQAQGTYSGKVFGSNPNFPFYADPMGKDKYYIGDAATPADNGPQAHGHLGPSTGQHLNQSSGMPASTTKINVWIEGAKSLKSGWVYKSDAYCVCRLDDKKGFETKILHGAGPDPEWHHGPEALPYHNEAELEFLVYDKEVPPKPDNLLGRATLPREAFLQNGYEGELALKDGSNTEPASLRVRVKVGASASNPHPTSFAQHSAHNPAPHSASHSASHSATHSAPYSSPHSGPHSAPHPASRSVELSTPVSHATGSLETQLRQLLQSQKQMQQDLAQIRSEMQSNYQTCMGETERLRRDCGVANPSSSHANPYAAYHNSAAAPPSPKPVDNPYPMADPAAVKGTVTPRKLAAKAGKAKSGHNGPCPCF